MDYRNGQIAQQIIDMQNEDGTWGYEFHSFSVPNNKKPLTTEQALRRLKNLGFTIKDEPIRKAVDCMSSCLRGERKIDNYWEKGIDWAEYTRLMLSTWIKIFESDNTYALEYARKYAEGIEKLVRSGDYTSSTYKVSFYDVNIAQGMLTPDIEECWINHIINYDKGIYYIYDKSIKELPKEFASLEASRYLAAVEILAGYEAAKEKLGFVVDWLEENKDENGQWDLGAKAKDNVYFPLSDSWRKAEYRKEDCTNRVLAILKKLEV